MWYFIHSITNWLFSFQEWNEELAEIAQAYSEMCIYGHNSDRHDQSTTFEFVGENLALTTAGAVDYVSLVQAWYDEVNDYTYSTMECAPGKACGHYTQVLTCSRLQWDLWWCHAGCLGNVKAYRVWCYQMCWNQSLHGCSVFRVQLWPFVSQLAWIWVGFISICVQGEHRWRVSLCFRRFVLCLSNWSPSVHAKSML